MCKRFGVSRSGFYASRTRQPSTFAQDDKQLTEQIRQAHKAGQGYYGSPRVTQYLRHQGVAVGRGRVARLMRDARLQGHGNGLFRSKARKLRFFSAVPNEVRSLKLSHTDQLWVGDVTYLKVAGQWRYLAVVMDRFSRRIIGWNLGAQRTAELTIGALQHAVGNRKPPPGVHFHSDRGIEYAALEFKAKLRQYGFIQSMNRPGSMNDNAHMESFFHSLKVEGLYKKKFDTDQQLREALVGYFQFYNQQRLHSALQYLAPAAYERSYLTQSGVHRFQASPRLPASLAAAC
jgi:putative transposase